jgi:hypothetical protein
MIRKIYARVLTTDLDVTLKVLRELAGHDPDFRTTFGRFEIALIGDFCVVAGAEENLARYRATVGPVIVDDLDATLAVLRQSGAEPTLTRFEGPVGLTALARHPDGVEYEYIEFSADLDRRVFP